MNKTTHAILLVADISGYTQFMKMHKISISHAKQIVVRLLKSLIKASRTPLKVGELEGDAVFFYALCAGDDIAKTAELVKEQIIALHNSFTEELELLRNLRLCNCPACRSAGDLKLKQIVHAGEVEVERIHNIKQIFGLDVIVIHRMLKNSIPSREYIMMTDSVYSNINDFYGLKPELHKEYFEGIGEINAVVYYPENIPNDSRSEKRKRVPSLIEKLSWFTKLMVRTIYKM